MRWVAKTWRALVPGLMAGCAAVTLAQPAVPDCEHDPSVTERFLPVELLTGEPLPDAEVLRLGPVQRRYPFVGVYADGSPPSNGETTLSGPVEHRTAYGPTLPAYERTVPGAREVVAITFDGEAIGRVDDSRIGPMREAKFPIGRWRQGETRHYTASYYTPRGVAQARTSITIEKLSCRYDGTPGAVAFRWKVEDGRRADYGYVFVPGRGLAQVTVYKRGGS
ncbi:hypothetical protein Tsedi_01058 [Tepidimonas sediminis]|uniref:Lipoprotein n=1 Tax=Tepidimonas sediminis TaxID=2588941 RepID=A0A554WQJ1_9BURK|nr:hypothetical protein Tsedi_01058 [Tepidimonas sediminis]